MKPAKKPRTARPLLERVSEDGNTSFARALGSVDFHTRERGLQALTVFLSTKQKLSAKEVRKLWKGLFYCYWHSDKEPVQEELASRLAAILPRLTVEVAAVYYEVFLETMEREWFGIDRLRLDKFLLLLRKFTRQLFVYLLNQNWNAAVVARYTGFLRDVMARSDEQPSAGLSYQIADVFVPELLGALRDADDSVPEAAACQLLDVFVGIMASSSRAALLPRIRAGVFDPLIDELRSSGREAPLGLLDVAGLAEHVFEQGARPGLRSRSRDSLYDLSKDLERLAGKKRKRDPTTGGSRSELAGPSDAVAEAALPKTKKLAKSTGDARGNKETPVSPKMGDSPAEPPAGSAKALGVAAGTAVPTGLRALPGLKGRAKALSVRAASSEPNGLGEAPAAAHEATPAEAARVRELAAEKVRELEAPPAVAGGTKKRSKRKKVKEAITAVKQAAGRTLGALGAHKQGKTTVNPATPGTPSDANLDSLFEASLNSAQAGQGQPGPQGIANGHAGPATRSASPKIRRASSGSGKHVQFALKRNLYFAPGQPVPALNVRTPESCRPKGSALKKPRPRSSPADSGEAGSGGARAFKRPKGTRLSFGPA